MFHLRWVQTRAEVERKYSDRNIDQYLFMQTYTVHTQKMTESYFGGEFQELLKEGENYLPVNLYATQTQYMYPRFLSSPNV